MRLLVVEDEIKTGDYLQQGLTERFALEDQLIQRLHAVHEPMAQSAPSGQSVS